MKQLAFFVVIGFSAIVLSGCTKTEAPTMDDASRQLQNQEGTKEMNEGENLSEENKMRQQWIEALARGESMRCTYTEEFGEVIMEMQGEKYQTRMQTPQGMMVSMFDGETLYTWDEEKKMGSLMTKACIEEIQQQFPDEDTSSEYYESSQDAIDSLTHISCEKALDINIQVPGDISFTDQCEMLKSQMEQLKNMPAGVPEIPEGMEIPQGMAFPESVGGSEEMNNFPQEGQMPSEADIMP